MIFTYRAGAELPNLTLPWQEETSAGTFADLDLSSGYTFALTLEPIAAGTAITPNATVTGSNGSVTIDWANDDLDIDPGVYIIRLRATETSTAHDRDYKPNNEDRIRIVA